jgi:hypothetical protein
VPGTGPRSPNGRARRLPPWLLVLLALTVPTLWVLSPLGPDTHRWRAAGGPSGPAGWARWPFGASSGAASDRAGAVRPAPGVVATVVVRREPPATRAGRTGDRATAPIAAPVAVLPVATPTRRLVVAAPVPSATTPPLATLPARSPPEAPDVAAPAEPVAGPPAVPATRPVVAPRRDGRGEITGRVVGPDGAPRAEIRIVAEAEGGVPPVETYSGADGRYALAVPAGTWLVHAEAPAYQIEWFGGLPSPYGAPVVTVPGGGRAEYVDFALRPYAGGRVTGRVVGVDGVPVNRALLVAVQATGAGTGPAAGYRAATFTREDGTYTLYVEPGEYAVGVARDWRLPPGAWWRSATELARADPVRAGADAAAAVDIVVR